MGRYGSTGWGMTLYGGPKVLEGVQGAVIYMCWQTLVLSGPPYSSEARQEYSKKVGFTSRPYTPEHPQGNVLAGKMMASIVRDAVKKKKRHIE